MAEDRFFVFVFCFFLISFFCQSNDSDRPGSSRAYASSAPEAILLFLTSISHIIQSQNGVRTAGNLVQCNRRSLLVSLFRNDASLTPWFIAIIQCPYENSEWDFLHIDVFGGSFARLRMADQWRLINRKWTDIYEPPPNAIPIPHTKSL